MNMKKWILFCTLLIALPGMATLAPYEKSFSKGKVVFYKESSMTTEQFNLQPYNTKPDPAWLESTAPLTPPMRQALSPEELDQIYIRLNSGSIVPGSYRGSAIMKGATATAAKNLILKKLRGVQLIGKAFCGQKDPFECFMEIAWKGKRIYAPESSTGEYALRNAVSKVTALGIKATLMPMKDQLNPENWLLKTLKPFDGDLKYMLFPAHLFCGQSNIDHRKESIVADYAWGSDFKPFIEGIDELFGRNLLNLREEFRMVRPGLYLGRAYAQKIFLFNFVLFNPEADPSASSEVACFDGKSTR
jgi:hypothetical protein